MKTRSVFNLLSLVMFLLVAICCAPKNETTPEQAEVEPAHDPLPSWNEGANKQAIIAYVDIVTNEQSPDFIPVADRIATFDNDGTLWSEQPFYFQLFFALDRVNVLSVDHPEWKNKQPF
jgi:hypothetical protein